MPIPKPNLDDKPFEALVEESIKAIPSLANEWTDHNRHDPGITFIELFAWLTEMQRFFLNQIPDQNRLKYLRLMGTGLRERTSARAEVTFILQDPARTDMLVAEGTRLLAGEQVFETSETLRVYDFSINRVLTSESAGLIDNSKANKQVGLSYYAFGREAAAGSRLYLGLCRDVVRVQLDSVIEDHQIPDSLKGKMSFHPATLTLSFFGVMTDTEKVLLLESIYLGDHAAAVGELFAQSRVNPLTTGDCVPMTFDLFDDYRDAQGNPVLRGRHGTEAPEIIPSAVLKWEYYRTGAEAGDQGWAPLDLTAELDQIYADILTGLPGNAPLCQANRERLTARLDTLQTIAVEERELVQKLVAAANTPYDLENIFTDPDYLSFKQDGTLMLTQSGRLHIKVPNEFLPAKPPPLPEPRFWIRAVVRDGGYELPPQIDAVQLHTIAAEQRDTLSEYREFSSDESADQVFEVQSFLALQALSVSSPRTIVQVQESDGTWSDWELADDFNSAGPLDPLYLLVSEAETEKVRLIFGDNRQGRIPPRGEHNIRLISVAAAFRTRHLLGRSNGLPSQAFSLEPGPVIPGTLRIQVAERCRVPVETSVSGAIFCLLDVERIAPAYAAPGDTIHITLKVRAKHNICHIEIKEILTADVVYEHTFPPEEEISAGREITFSYILTLNENWRGGTLAGQIILYTNRSCTTLSDDLPMSVIHVGSPERTDQIRWRDWARVEDFDSSDSGDYHYQLSSDGGEIIFGDGINGAIPDPLATAVLAGVKNIRTISYQIGGGGEGNVIQESIRAVDPAAGFEDALKVINRRSAGGGLDRETLAEAIIRTRKDMKTPYRAVTSADYELLTLNTPGLRVKRAKALPLYKPGLPGYPEQTTPAAMTVIVVPFTETSKPLPGAGFLHTVCRHLAKHRLLTTRLHVVPPQYVVVDVRATVRLRKGAKFDTARELVDTKLIGFLDPLSGGLVGDGWPFGRPVYKSEIYQVIENVVGVDCVENVILNASGAGVSRDSQGNIVILPQSLVCAGEMSIEILLPDEACRTGGRR